MRLFSSFGEEVIKGIDKRMGRMLVEIDVTKGFLDEVEIKWKYITFIQNLDYWGLPFRCSHCIEVGHMWRACKTSSNGSVSDDSLDFYGDWLSLEARDS